MGTLPARLTPVRDAKAEQGSPTFAQGIADPTCESGERFP